MIINKYRLKKLKRSIYYEKQNNKKTHTNVFWGICFFGAFVLSAALLGIAISGSVGLSASAFSTQHTAAKQTVSLQANGTIKYICDSSESTYSYEALETILSSALNFDLEMLMLSPDSFITWLISGEWSSLYSASFIIIELKHTMPTRYNYDILLDFFQGIKTSDNRVMLISHFDEMVWVNPDVLLLPNLLDYVDIHLSLDLFSLFFITAFTQINNQLGRQGPSDCTIILDKSLIFPYSLAVEDFNNFFNIFKAYLKFLYFDDSYLNDRDASLMEMLDYLNINLLFELDGSYPDGQLRFLNYRYYPQENAYRWLTPESFFNDNWIDESLPMFALSTTWLWSDDNARGFLPFVNDTKLLRTAANFNLYFTAKLRYF